jgi:hypothetical protein
VIARDPQRFAEVAEALTRGRRPLRAPLAEQQRGGRL